MEPSRKQPIHDQRIHTRQVHTIRISGFTAGSGNKKIDLEETQRAFKRLQLILRLFPFLMIVGVTIIFYIVYILAGKHFPMFILVSAFTIMLIKELSTLLFSVSMRKNLIKPINELRDAVDEVAEGNYGYTIRPSNNNLVRDLVNSFNRMSLELKEANEIKKRYETNRTELIAGISHDLKTPITSIIGYVNGIQSGVADCDEKLDNYLNIIASNAEYTNQLIDELFLFSKLDINQMEYHFEDIPINDFFTDIFIEKQLELEEKGVELTYHINIVEDAIINLDAKMIYRVLSNLINNAIKYSDKEQIKIDITLTHIDTTPNGILLKVKDNGRGITQDNLSKIFDVFYRADASRNKDIGGSGLGLAISRQLVEAHDGRIWAESTVGEGSTFYFTLRESLLGNKDAEV